MLPQNLESVGATIAQQYVSIISSFTHQLHIYANYIFPAFGVVSKLSMLILSPIITRRHTHYCLQLIMVLVTFCICWCNGAYAL